jgi:hypothetical protein
VAWRRGKNRCTRGERVTDAPPWADAPGRADVLGWPRNQPPFDLPREASGTVLSIKIVIRYYDASGKLIFEDLPTLRHLERVPRQWIRWEIYWDEELVDTGTRPAPRAGAVHASSERRGQPSQPSRRERPRGGTDPTGSTAGRDPRTDTQGPSVFRH